MDSETARAFIQESIDEHGFLGWLDCQVEHVAAGEMHIRVPYDEKLTNTGPGGAGNVNGGVAATLVDLAGGLAVRSTLDDPVGSGVATIDLNVSYLEPAAGDLLGRAEVVRTGSTVGVARIDVDSRTPDGEEAVVATGRGSFRLFTGER